MPRSYQAPKSIAPDEAIKYRGKDQAPDEPGEDAAEGHGVRIKYAKDKAPDEPGNDAGDQPAPEGTVRIKF
jgi:hypothetical protein